MADGIEFRVFTEPFTKMIEEKKKRMPRASMWAVREAGRVVKRTSRAAAPVLKSKTLLTHQQLQRGRRAGLDVAGYYTSGTAGGRTSTAGTGPIPGLLKASIKTSRNLGHRDGEYTLKVWPSGARTHLYATKIETRAHYMAAGETAAHLEFRRIVEQAVGRVWR